MDNTDHAAQTAAGDLFSNGFTRDLVSVIPPKAPLHPDSEVHEDQLGKAPGKRTASGQWVGGWYNATSPTVARMFDKWRANVGIETTRIIPIDFDVNDPALHNPLVLFARKYFNNRAPVRYGARPLVFMRMKGECHIGRTYIRFRLPGSDVIHKVETFFGPKKQFVISGIHPSGKLYTCMPKAGELQFDRLPTTTEQEVRGFFVELEHWLADKYDAVLVEAQNVNGADRGEKPDPETLIAEFEKVAAAVRAIPNTKGRERWIQVCHAIKGATQDEPEEGYALWMEWCESREDGDPHLDEATRVWNSAGRMDGLYIGYDALLQMAGKRAELASREFDQFGDPLDESEIKGPDPVVEGFCVRPVADRTLVRPQWIIQDILPQGRYMGVLYGPPGNNKSTLATTVAVHVALGLPFNGHTTRPGRVLVIPEEDAVVNRRRITAWEQRLRQDKVPEATIALLRTRILEPYPSFGRMSRKRVRELIAAVKASERDGDPPLQCVFIDTIARTFTEGGEENNSADMNKYIDLSEQLSEELNCPVFALHHPNKGDGSLRGHSALVGAVGAIWRIERNQEDKLVRLYCEKQREAAEFAPMAFSPIPMDISLKVPRSDEDDDTPVTALILDPVDWAEPPTPGNPRTKRREASESPGDEFGTTPATERAAKDTEILRVMLDRPLGSLAGWSAALGTSRSALYRRMQRLCAMGYVAHDPDNKSYSVTTTGHEAFVSNTPDGPLY